MPCSACSGTECYFLRIWDCPADRPFFHKFYSPARIHVSDLVPLPKQLFANLSNIRNVESVFVLDFNGDKIEGKLQNSGFSVFLTFLWYKQKKILNQFYSDSFHYIQVRQTDGYLFIFENSPNLIVVKTNFKVIIPEFKLTIKKILAQLRYK